MPKSHQVADSDRGRSTSSYVCNFDGNVKTGDTFMDRFSLDNLVGTPTLIRTAPSSKNVKIGTDGKNGTNEYKILEPPSHFGVFLASQLFF